jgi:hypothetical protein
MKRLAFLALLIASMLSAAAPAGASLPRAGVGLVDATEPGCISGVCAWRASYNSLLGLGEHHLTAEWSADGSHWTFDDPHTVMLVQPRVGGTQLCTAAVFRRAVCTMQVTADAYNGGCEFSLTGGISADVITVRNLTTAPTACPKYVTDDFGIAPGFAMTVVTDRGNDTINVRDGLHSYVNCGPGYDRAIVDFGDGVSNCEAVAVG